MGSITGGGGWGEGLQEAIFESCFNSLEGTPKVEDQKQFL